MSTVKAPTGRRGSPAGSRSPRSRTGGRAPAACPCGRGSRACSRITCRLEAADRQVLQLQPLVDSVLRALTADARLLDAAERRYLGRDEARVDADDPVLERLGDAPDPGVRPRIEVCGQAVRRVVGDPHRLLLGLEAGDAGDRAERLLAAHGHLHRHPGQHRRLEELALQPASADDELRAALDRIGEVTLDLLDGRLVDQRADVDTRGEAVGDGRAPRRPR